MSDTPKGSKMARLADEKVGSNIRLRRTMLGLTQEQLASALNISYQQVQKYETGANRISAGRLYEIARHLNVEIGFFFEGLQPTAESTPLPHGGRNRPTIELVKNFTDIQDAAIRGAVSNLVRTLTHHETDQARATSDPGTEAFEGHKEAS